MYPRLTIAFLSFVALAGTVLAQHLRADIALPKLFSDHMVLQQKRSQRIWGTADANEQLSVAFNQQKVDVTADPQGRWSAIIKVGAAGGPFQLEVASRDSETKVVFNDVMVGEVWICGGQSNMEWPVNKLQDAEQEVERAKDYPNIRLFRVEHHASAEPLEDFVKVSPWFCCSPETIKDFSATAYFFGRELSEELGVPIGLINIARENTTLEAWTPIEALRADPQSAQLLQHWKDNDELNSPNRVSVSYNGMVAPLSRFSFRGVIWSQGEANVGRGAQYQRLFPLMINSWRDALQNRECPFYFVQLAPYRYEARAQEALPEIWDAQLRTFKSVPHTGMVVTLDVGDPTNLHPDNKQIVAKRLSFWPLNHCYLNERKPARDKTKPSTNSAASNETLTSARATRELSSDSKSTIFSGPIYDSMEIVDDRVVISFRFSESGLKIDTTVENCFTICGADHKFVPARVEVHDSKLWVSSPQIESPIAVRYGWQDTAQPMLSNDAGLPASPFRTDQFPLLSEGVEF